jgi:hypothetical protein
MVICNFLLLDRSAGKRSTPEGYFVLAFLSPRLSWFRFKDGIGRRSRNLLFIFWFITKLTEIIPCKLNTQA